MGPELVWMLALHISGLVVWCAALLYLPALIASGPFGELAAAPQHGGRSLARVVFTLIATPAALFAIVTGSLLLLLDRTLGLWFILKLTAVAGLVLGHVLCGVLILYREGHPHASVKGLSALLGSVSTVLIAMVLWLVLAKPI